MTVSISRKEFLKMSLLVQAGFVLPSIAYSLPKPTAPSDDMVYYKKGEAAYELLRQGFNKRISHYPAVIALCNNTAGVAAAVRYANQNKLPVAIKSGGHCMEGFSGNDGGMVINLSLLNRIEWMDATTVKIGPGCLLHQLYEALLPKGRLIPGGSCGGVGIGGLVLGGGYGLLSRSLGLTCDSLLDATMVDGSGNIIKASSDPNLLWGLRGGGNGNFGIVTELVFKTHKAPATMQSLRFRKQNVQPADAVVLLKDWFAATASLSNSCFSAFIYNGRATYILLTTTDKTYSGAANFIQQLSKNAGRLTKTKSQPLAKALKVFYGQQQPILFKNASAGLYKDYATIEGCIEEVMQLVHQSRGMIYQLNTLGGHLQNEQLEKQSAFPHRAYPYFSGLQTYWDSPKQGQRLLQQFAAVQSVMAKQGITAQYRNYPDADFAQAQQLYYGNSYPQLQQLKAKYDPGNIIRYPQSVKL